MRELAPPDSVGPYRGRYKNEIRTGAFHRETVRPRSSYRPHSPSCYRSDFQWSGSRPNVFLEAWPEQLEQLPEAMKQLRRRTTGKRKRAIALKSSATQGDVGGFDEGRDAVAYLKPHVLHRAGGNNGGHLADAGLHDDLTQHLVRDNLLHGAGYFVANRLFHKSHPSSSAIDCATGSRRFGQN